MSKKIITCLIMALMVASSFSVPALGYGETSVSENQIKNQDNESTKTTEPASNITDPEETAKPTTVTPVESVPAPIVKPAAISKFSGRAISYQTISLSWTKAKNAQAYEVYRRSSSKVPYTKITATTKNQYKSIRLSGNIKYSYKVRPYRTQNGKKYYGPFSKVINVKTKQTGPQKIVAKANTRVGCKYRAGASGPKKFDCSGLVYWVYKNAGATTKKKVKRTSSAGMYKALKKYKVASGINGIKKAQPGDIILFKRGGRYSHAAIYVGGGKIVHATTPRRGVVKESVTKVHKSGTRVDTIVRIAKK